MSRHITVRVAAQAHPGIGIAGCSPPRQATTPGLARRHSAGSTVSRG
jgi:hypothetical protein